MANTSIYAAFERMWQHVVAALGNKSDVNHNHDDVYYTESEIDAMIEDVGSITINLEGSTEGDANTINADTLGGYAASEYVKVSDLDGYLRKLGVIE